MVVLQLNWESVHERYSRKVEIKIINESDGSVDSGQLQFEGEAAALNVQRSSYQNSSYSMERGNKNKK